MTSNTLYARIRRMLAIFQMWLMVRFMEKRQDSLAAIWKVGDPALDKIKETHGEGLAAVLGAHMKEEKTLVAKNILKKLFVLNWFPYYLFKKKKNTAELNIQTVAYARHFEKANRILLNCIKKGFLESSKKYDSYVFITLEGEQFSTPLGLLRELVIYMTPLGAASAVGATWLITYLYPHVVHFYQTGIW